MGNQSKPMKKLLCILASAALLGACEDKTVVAPTTTSPAPDKKVENNTTVVNPTEKEKTKETTNTRIRFAQLRYRRNTSSGRRSGTRSVVACAISPERINSACVAAFGSSSWRGPTQ